jgi:hypothetical protein
LDSGLPDSALLRFGGRSANPRIAARSVTELTKELRDAQRGTLDHSEQARRFELRAKVRETHPSLLWTFQPRCRHHVTKARARMHQARTSCQSFHADGGAAGRSGGSLESAVLNRLGLPVEGASVCAGARHSGVRNSQEQSQNTSQETHLGTPHLDDNAQRLELPICKCSAAASSSSLLLLLAVGRMRVVSATYSRTSIAVGAT